MKANWGLSLRSLVGVLGLPFLVPFGAKGTQKVPFWCPFGAPWCLKGAKMVPKSESNLGPEFAFTFSAEVGVPHVKPLVASLSDMDD